MIRKNVAEILQNHVTFELEAIDRMYLNAYVPSLQTGGGMAYFLKAQLGVRVPSTVMVAPMSERFVDALERFAETEGVDLVTFKKGQRKDAVAQTYLAKFQGEEGVLFIGKAQEKASVFRTEKRRDAHGKTYPWIIRSTAMPNQYYIYILELDAPKIDAVFRKWLRRLPHPFAPAHRAAGYRYHLSILQAEFALTQVLDRPLTGRSFFEEVIRENLDLGRPDQMQLIFNRRVTRRTPGRFRTRVLTEGVVPSLHVEYKKSKVKQYHKEGQALRTETTINDTYDFAIGRALHNLPALREIGFAANRRLLHVESLSHDCLIGEDHLHTVTSPVRVDDQRAAGLRFGDRRVQALMHALCLFALAPTGFRHREFRDHVAQLQSQAADTYSAGSMTYDLRRLRLHGLIERVPRSHRYRITPTGAQVAMFYARLYTRALRPASSLQPSGSTRAQHAFDRLDAALAAFLQEVKLAA